MIIAYKTKAGLFNYGVFRKLPGGYEEYIDGNRQGYSSKAKLVKGLVAGIEEREASLGWPTTRIQSAGKKRLMRAIHWMSHSKYTAFRRGQNAKKAKMVRGRKK